MQIQDNKLIFGYIFQTFCCWIFCWRDYRWWQIDGERTMTLRSSRPLDYQPRLHLSRIEKKEELKRWFLVYMAVSSATRRILHWKQLEWASRDRSKINAQIYHDCKWGGIHPHCEHSAERANHELALLFVVDQLQHQHYDKNEWEHYSQQRLHHF